MKDANLIGHWDVSSLEKVASMARQIAHILTPGDILLLRGDLGAGKTTFSRFVIQTLLGRETETPSPTFALVHPYDTPKGPLWHVDLYRLTPLEVPALGLEEQWGHGIMLIEWPERLPYQPPDPLTLSFSIYAPAHPPMHADAHTDAQTDAHDIQRSLSIQGSFTWHNRLSAHLPARLPDLARLSPPTEPS